MINIFVGKEMLYFTLSGATKQDVHLVLYNCVILTQVSVPPERHELSFSTLNC